MAKPETAKDKGKEKDKAKAKGPPPGQEKAKPKKEKAPAPAAAEGKDAGKEKEKPKPAPRPPADPRLKVLKKFYGKFLPRGPLRDRHKALMQRWNSGEDHGGLTVDELKSLYDDWKAARARKSSAMAR
jgi:hypothetical protein